MASVPATQQLNEVEVSGGVCEMVCDLSVLKTPHKYIGRRYCASEELHCALLFLHHMCNFTHTEASEIKKRAGYDVDKDNDYWGMNIIQFKIFY